MDENDIRPKFLEIEHKKVIKNDVMWLKRKTKKFFFSMLSFMWEQQL